MRRSAMCPLVTRRPVNAKFMGVCRGIADSVGWDVTLVRVGFVAGTLLGFGSLLIVYLAIGFVAD